MGEQCEPEEFPNGFGGLCDACAEIGAKVFAGSTSQKINRSKQSMIYANRDGDTILVNVAENAMPISMKFKIERWKKK